MSSQQKGDLVVNPTTQRAVKEGSRVWIKLVKDGLLPGGDVSDSNEL
jgi:hypothetical protein